MDDLHSRCRNADKEGSHRASLPSLPPPAAGAAAAAAADYNDKEEQMEILKTLNELGSEYEDLSLKEKELLALLHRLRNEEQVLESAISQVRVAAELPATTSTATIPKTTTATKSSRLKSMGCMQPRKKYQGLKRLEEALMMEQGLDSSSSSSSSEEDD